MGRTNIAWTDATWNPVTGCSKVSAGCKNCYAEAVAHRFWADRKFTDVQYHEDRLTAPLRWRKPRKVFVNSMSDLFHDDVPDSFIDRVFAVMAMSPQHTFQVLTKRPERMRQYMKQQVFGHAEGFTYGDRIARIACDILAGLPERLGNSVARRMLGLRTPWPLPNVWLGVSVENQSAADDRIPHLLATPAAVRFLSCEPLLSGVDIRRWLPWHLTDKIELPAVGGSPIDWVIVGGESGPGARPCDVAWIRSIVQQCQTARVPVFVKQLGSKAGLRGSKGGDPSEWPEDLRVREFPAGRAP